MTPPSLDLALPPSHSLPLAPDSPRAPFPRNKVLPPHAVAGNAKAPLESATCYMLLHAAACCYMMLLHAATCCIVMPLLH
eukprot:11944608-Alexandrium_andersonii.AAC.1